MKRVIGAAVGLAAAVALAVALSAVAYGASPPPSTLLSSVDINTAGVVTYTWTGSAPAGSCGSFNPETPGSWGGENAGGAVTASPSDTDNAGYCTLNTGGTFARHIELRVLDGIADDSFDVYVKDPGGQWALVYSYTDKAPGSQSDTETWLVHHIYSFPAGKGQGDTVETKIVPTNCCSWWGFAQYGQLAVDYIKLFDH